MERFDSMVRGLLLVILIAVVKVSCEYPCNCHECDKDTGACPGNCLAGWVKGGHWCQKQNIAYMKNAWTRPSANYRIHWLPKYAVDGNNNIKGGSDTCFYGIKNLVIDLGKRFKLYHIRIYLRHDFEWTISSAEISDNEKPSSVCYTFPAFNSNNPIDVVCDMVARYIKIEKPGIGGAPTDTSLSICEVEIYQCSHWTYGKDCTNFCHCSSCDDKSGVCTGDCFEGWQGARCDIACNGKYGINCHQDCKSRQCASRSSSCNPFTGWCDTGCLAGWQGIDCTYACNGRYGINCHQDCKSRHCASRSSSCNRFTGRCDTGCLAGWQGIDCTYACNGRYGINCHQDCKSRHCASRSSSCNRFTGRCDTGCLAGWQGIDCTYECDPKYYGQNCSKLCAERNCYGQSECSNSYGFNCNKTCKDRKCAGNSVSCDSLKGSCDSCLPGWQGVDCTKKCDSLHYGTNCTRKCRDRHCTDMDASCNHKSGRCDQGCLSGWRGDDCSEACEPTHYGQNCSRECSSRQCNGVMDCNSASGQCLEGCLSGWSGIDCTEKIERLKVGRYLFVITAVIVGCLAAIVVVIIVVVIIRRRRLIGANRSRKPQAVDNECADIALEDRESNSPNFERKHTAQPAVVEQGRSLDTENVEDTYSVCTRDWDGEEHEEDGRTGDYCNLDEVGRDHSTSIPVSQLLDKINEFRKNPKSVEEEYKGLPDGFMHPYDESQTAENNKKNRYKGYYPYSYNRVVLCDVAADTRGDYINASYIDGYQSERKYIAAQGPYKDHLVIDFWRMLWQEGCKVVVMVTGLVETGRMKCLRYWPGNGSEEYGDVTVTKKSENVMADFTITALSVQHRVEKKNRQVVHFHFTSWPDHGVPDTSSLLSYMSKVKSTAGNQNNPIVVHCSAGIGRTGTYIAVEGLIQQAATEGVVDVVSFVSKMREQRKNMIQTKEQYHFIYRALASAVFEGDTVLAADDITKIELRRVGETRMGNRTVQGHLEIIKKTHKEARKTTHILSVPSYRSRCGYLVMTSSPDKEELWEQICNSGSRSLITWSGRDKKVVPVDKSSVSTSRFTVWKRQSTELSDNILLQKLEMERDGGSEATVLYHYQLSGSLGELNVSALAESLLPWTDRPECRTSTIVSRSVSETRLLVLLLNLISRLQDDGKMDIISDMRRLQSPLPATQFTVADVRTCVKLAQRQLESLNVYVNL